MKIVAVTSSTTVLAEVSINELKTITEYNWKPPYTERFSGIELDRFKPGDVIELPKAFEHAKELLQTFRGIAPGLRQSAKRLENLASQVELHEPNHSLLPKADT